MEGLSKKELELISWLEFEGKKFFTSEEVNQFAKDKTQRYNMVKHLLKKKRIVKLNKNKYFLIPIKAKEGYWSEHPLILADEIMNGKDYFIGGWAAANYWQLTDQIPFHFDIYTTKKQGTMSVLATNFHFHRTTKNHLKNGVEKKIRGHTIRLFSREKTKKWLHLRN